MGDGRWESQFLVRRMFHKVAVKPAAQRIVSRRYDSAGVPFRVTTTASTETEAERESEMKMKRGGGMLILGAGSSISAPMSSPNRPRIEAGHFRGSLLECWAF